MGQSMAARREAVFIKLPALIIPKVFFPSNSCRIMIYKFEVNNLFFYCTLYLQSFHYLHHFIYKSFAIYTSCFNISTFPLMTFMLFIMLPKVLSDFTVVCRYPQCFFLRKVGVGSVPTTFPIVIQFKGGNFRKEVQVLPYALEDQDHYLAVIIFIFHEDLTYC